MAFWQLLIRYAVAFDLSLFGWQKINHLQFITPLGKLDEPFNRFTSEDPVWAFFGHSYPFICLIAICQITGALLLLHHRTRLAGVFVLLPVMLNIFSIDIFYHLAPGVILHAGIMLSGVLYFLFVEYGRLKEFFLKPVMHSLPLSLPGYLKTAIRLSVIYIPVLLIAGYDKPDKDPALKGKIPCAKLCCK